MRPEDFTRQIEQFRARQEKLESELSNPGVYAVPARASMLARERQRLEGIFASYNKWTDALKSAGENRALLESEHDAEFRALIESDLAEQEQAAADAEQELLMRLVPPDRTDSRDAIVEIKKRAITHQFDVLLVFMFDRLGRRDDETPFVVQWFVQQGI